MSEDTVITGLVPDEPENIDEVTTTIASLIDEKSQVTQPRNRAERRALIKKIGKKNFEELSSITETAKKLDYIELIQKFRKLNEQKEKENNENIS